MKFFTVLWLVAIFGAAHAADTCPGENGYSVNAAGDCVTHCDKAYYVPTPGAPCTVVPGGGSYYVDTAHDVKYGETSTNMLRTCPTTAAGEAGFVGSNTADNPAVGSDINRCLRVVNVSYDSSDRGTCVADATNSKRCIYETHGVISAPCYYTTGSDGAAIYDKRNVDPAAPGAIRLGCVANAALVKCDAGWWDPRNGVAFSNSMPQYNPCQPVGTGYYSPAGDLKRYACPAGTATCGYGDCAKSASDCKAYKTIYTSNGVSLILQPDKRTTPALTVQMPDGSVWYSQSDAGARGGHININYKGAPYALIDPMDLFIEFINLGNVFLVPEKAVLPY